MASLKHFDIIEYMYTAQTNECLNVYNCIGFFLHTSTITMTISHKNIH